MFCYKGILNTEYAALESTVYENHYLCNKRKHPTLKYCGANRYESDPDAQFQLIYVKENGK